VLKVAQTFIEINANIYGNYTRIIIEQAPSVPPANAPPPGPAYRPPAPNELKRPGAPAVPPGAAVVVPTPPTPTFSINPNTFIDDEEYGLNVEDFDMEVRWWSELISSILKFQKSVLFNDTIFTLSKTLIRNKI
jgi:hypothetical protein